LLKLRTVFGAASLDLFLEGLPLSVRSSPVQRDFGTETKMIYFAKFKNNVNSSMRTGIYICPIENENILEKQKIRGDERNYDVTVP
jgi:hypothetical protein